ncbi:uncharacterized protein LOC114526820 isoform X2 [Dendronephthya gigantea]|uniref:uncharacterized protein LOC114526820 isoform X2 n=1 Tax=Dendronephthya gigantea TaxID=151771 RepID=UPI0010691265|nr:uncharacterized protein LOC114526820 isoform X2 [Dendronephthya gigantea]
MKASQYRKIYYRFCNIKRRYSIFFIIIGIILFSIYFRQHRKHNVSSITKNSRFINGFPMAMIFKSDEKEIAVKDNYYLVTAISSHEFIWLLKFVDTLFSHGGELELIVWSLDLRDCEFNYVKNLNTPFRIHLHRFPYHFHPLHIRYYHLNAIKPIVLESASLTYGEIIWIEPSVKLPLQLDSIIEILSDKSFIAASSSNPSDAGHCQTYAIGVNYIRSKTLIEAWAQCARNRSCIAAALNRRTGHQSVIDMFFEKRRKDMKLPCTVFNTKAVEIKTDGVLKQWESNKEARCKQHKVCVLTGSHRTHGCLTPQLARLRQNKRKYTDHHGYVYIEEAFGFHRNAPCHRVWDKVHAILKHLAECRLLFWVDTDAIFLDMDRTLESFFDAYLGKEFLVSWPRTDRMLNAGVLLMRNTPTMHEFFQNITNGKTWKNDWCSHSKFEQAAIRDQLDSGSMDGRFAVERSNMLQTLCSFRNKECAVTKKDFIAHFAPPDCPKLHDLVKTFLDDNQSLI